MVGGEDVRYVGILVKGIFGRGSFKVEVCLVCWGYSKNVFMVDVEYVEIRGVVEGVFLRI